MSQHDYNIANQTFPATRTDLNNALGAIATNNAGNSAPSTTYANQWWFDSDGNQLYIRNKDNDAWVKVFTIGATSDKIEELATDSLILGGTTPTLTIGDGGAEDTKIVFDGNTVDYVLGLDDSADEFRIGVGSGLGSDRVFEINSSGVSTFQKAVTFAGSTPTVTIGDGGAEDAKMIFDGNAQNFSIGLDDSTDKLTIGLGNTLGQYPAITIDENTNVVIPDSSLTIIGSGNYDLLTLTSTDADANSGPNLRLYRNSSSPADDDLMGTIEFEGRNDNSQDVVYAQMSIESSDVSDGTEDANWFVKVMSAGTLRNLLQLNAGEVVFNQDSQDTDFRVESNAKTNSFFIDAGLDRTFIGDSADTLNDNGLTINQSTGDNPIFALKSSDVAHGITDVAETDTYAYFEKKGGAQGGLVIGGLVESGFIAGIELNSNVTQADNAETTGAEGAIQTQSLIKSGTGTTAMGADDNIFVCRNSTTQFIVKGDGELFSNQSATVGTFDEYEDAHLVRAYDLSHGKGVIDSSFDKFVKYNKDDLRKARLIGSDKEGNATPFVNITGMSRLHNGAIWQQYEKHQRLASAFYKLAEKTIGKEEADKLLTEEEIKLLN